MTKWYIHRIYIYEIHFTMLNWFQSINWSNFNPQSHINRTFLTEVESKYFIKSP